MAREEDIIRSFFRNGNHPPDDDCALLENGLLLTTDSMSDGFHFHREWSSPADLAIKLFQSNLSDIAASGGDPVWALLNIGVPPSFSNDEILTFAFTLNEELEKYGVKLAGGDTYGSDRLQLNLTLGGRVVRHLPRSGGRIGDSVYLTGSVGLSIAGYMHLSKKIDLLSAKTDNGTVNESVRKDLLRESLNRHLRPVARYEESRILRENSEVHGAMDLSDGIYRDIPRLATASGLSLEIELSKIPIYKDLSTLINREILLESGEEYEILFFGKPGLCFPFQCTEIGYATDSSTEGAVVWKDYGRVVKPVRFGFDHFKREEYGEA